MSWIRTSVSMITFGFTIGKIGQSENAKITGLLGLHTYSVQGIGSMLVALGTLALVIASYQYAVRVREIRKAGYPSDEIPISFYIAILLALIGGFALTSLVANL